MRTTMLMSAALLAACGGTKRSGTGEPMASSAAAETGAPATMADMPPAGEDVTAKVIAMNSEDFASPPTEFRAGHVTPRTPPTMKKTRTGFEIRFASGAPVTTPAVYGGKVFVSGGFQSKEFHAFAATTGQSAWSIDLDDDGPSSAVCDDGVCVFNTESCTVFAVSAATGKQLWSWWLGDPLTSSPTIADGRVFTSYPATSVAKGSTKPRPPNATHALAAFDLRTGKLLWQKWLDSDVMSAPVATGGFVYASTFAGTLIKFEQATGKVRYALRAKATSAPVVQFAADGMESTYFTKRGDAEADGAEELIIRTDHNHPKTKYKTRAKKAEYLDKDVQRKSKYAAEGESNDSGNGFSGGAPASANPNAAAQNIGFSSVANMQAFQGSRLLHLGDRNVNTMGDEVVATSAETGETLWSMKLHGDVAREGGFLGTAPLAAGGSVLVATLKGTLMQLDPKTGTVQATYEVGGRVRAQPVVANGWIYVGTEDGRLVGINTGNKKLTGWPMWGGNAGRTGIQLAGK
ncbi:MAG TPA: PQQ-binding-like beta-propeller repeat protein [Kofleriaceae bacterium]|nr:PQQ-binding-like beta-propeller repeat protein [Kofleriaceae bacterium]